MPNIPSIEHFFFKSIVKSQLFEHLFRILRVLFHLWSNWISLKCHIISFSLKEIITLTHERTSLCCQGITPHNEIFYFINSHNGDFVVKLVKSWLEVWSTVWSINYQMVYTVLLGLLLGFRYFYHWSGIIFGLVIIDLWI